MPTLRFLDSSCSLQIIDNHLVSIADLGVNFFLQENNIGQIRSQVVCSKLQELNPICTIRIASELNESTVLAHSTVVITSPLPLSEMIRLDEFTRANGISFLSAFVGGVSGTVFVDHGANHMVNDKDGERPIQKLIVEVKPYSENETLIRYESPEGQPAITISSGHFEITEVVGIDGINGSVYEVQHSDSDPVKTVRVPFAMKPGDQYEAGGIITEKKVATPYPMDSLASKVKSPGNTFAFPPTLVLTDLINFGAEYQQHLSYVATMSFFEKTGRLPYPYNQDDTNDILAIAKSLVADKAVDIGDMDLDESFVQRYAGYAGVELQCMAAFIGGVLAQEVVKATGKLTPIPGFFHFSAIEALPDAVPSEDDRKPRSSRYDELASMYGWNFVEKISNLNYFMVGCGALGCEFLKNFALNGVCCGPKGKLTVTDPDRIELSNLSRQFLFREHNVGQPKSRAGSVMAKVMNPDLKIEPLELLLGAKSEETFVDAFWMELDGVCNALDNMEARFYVDTQCVKYEKSLLESGTMGTGANVDTIVPFKTRTYREGGVAAEGGGVPMCTLRNFPHITDHCIEWSRDQFEFLFVKLPKTCEAFLSNPTKFEEDTKVKAGTEAGVAFFDAHALLSFMRATASPSIGACVQLAYDLFHYLFRDRILDLQAAFPPDTRMVDKNGVDKGAFWGEKRRYPTVAVFNPSDQTHIDFMISATCLFGVAIGLLPAKTEDDENWLSEFRSASWIINIIDNLQPPTYLQAPISSEGLEHAPEVKADGVDEMLAALFDDLKSSAAMISSPPAFQLAEFEKDDDLNFHVSFITATANLRCDNYSIKRTDFHACKVIAGRIIAALATTTAAVCGLVILELFKVAMDKPTDALMNRQLGLASNTYTSFTQEPPKKFKTHVELEYPSAEDNLPSDAYDDLGRLKDEFITKITKRAYPEGHSIWDKISCSANLSIKEFSQWLADEHKLKLNKWDFVVGYKTVIDPESKAKVSQPYSTPVYPPKVVLNYSLLPSLDLTLAQATTAIMRNPLCKPTQQYVALWKEAKAVGAVPEPPAEGELITENTSLKEILERMSALGDEYLAKGVIEVKTVSSLASRQIWVIPSGEVPVVSDLESGDDIDVMCSVKITL
jgi:ubiquitin-activating enzyme E1